MTHLSQERQADERSALFPKCSRSGHREVETPVNTDDVASIEDAADAKQRKKKVSLLWLLISFPLLTLASSALAAPRLEIFTTLVCRTVRPEYSDAVNTMAEHSSRNCATDPVVQAGLSKLLAVTTMTSGLISCTTASWWGSFSDRHGRTLTLGISVFTTILSILNMVLVAKFSSSLPGNYWFLLVGSVFEGLMGGGATMTVATEAYVVDCTDSSSRSRMLSIITGVLSVGATLGPAVGGLLIHAFHQVHLVFYISIIVLLFYAVLVLIVIPESLSKEQMLANKNAYTRRQPDGSVLTTFLAPLTMFAPTRFETADGQPRMDWNLTLLGIVYAIFSTILLPSDYLLQYMSYVFAWTSESISYWLSVTGTTKTIFCLLLLPMTIAWLKKRSTFTSLPIDPSEPLNVPLLLGGDNPSEAFPSQQPTLEETHSSSFDLSLARVSLLIFVVSYAIMGLVSNPWVFTVASTFSQFGTGYLPCLHSLAMGMFVLKERRMKGAGAGEDGLIPTETGKLYSSLTVMQVFCSIALGPGIFALIFMATVSFFPAAVFVFIFVGLSISFYLLSLVQLPKGSANVVEHHD